MFNRVRLYIYFDFQNIKYKQKMTKNNDKIIWSWNDSDVYIEKGVLRKYYANFDVRRYEAEMNLYRQWWINKKPELYKTIAGEYYVDKDTLQKYHKIHHELSKFEFMAEIEWKDIYLWDTKIDKVKIKILDLWDTEIAETYHILSHEPIYITEPQYIQELYNTANIFEIQNDSQKVNSVKIIENIIEEYFIKIWLGVVQWPENTNIKITWFENGVLEVTVTDLGNSIIDFVKYEDDIYKWITHNQDRKANTYEPVPQSEEDKEKDLEFINLVLGR